jgi:hypothetical protein
VALDKLVSCVNQTKPCSTDDNKSTLPLSLSSLFTCNNTPLTVDANFTEAVAVVGKMCTFVGIPTGNSSNSSATASYIVPASLSTSTSTSSPHSSEKVTLGVGLGLGLPIMAIIGALVGFILFRARQSRNSGSNKQWPVPQHSEVPYSGLVELEAQPKIQEMESRPEELDAMDTWSNTR